MTIARVNGIDLCFETAGEPGGLPLLLVSGLGMQLTGWRPELLDRLVAEGCSVVTFDNRDVGLSTHLDAAGVPDLAGVFEGRAPKVPYLLADLADDAAGLLEHLSLASAHVVGVSMGGMVAQEVAIRHPERTRSLVSIMSTTGDPAVGQPSAEALEVLLSLAASNRDEAIAAALASSRVIGSPAYPPDPVVEAARAAADYDRDHDPDGFARQLGAVVCSPDRTAALRGVSAPTLVLHGESDPLVAVSGGEATAAAVPGARLVTYPGMGHDLPLALVDAVGGEIVAHARTAEAVAVVR